MFNPRKILDELRRGSSEVRIDAQPLQEWKEDVRRFLHFEPEADSYILHSSFAHLQQPSHAEYDMLFAHCCNQYMTLQEMSSPEQRAAQLIDAYYDRYGVERLLREALAYAAEPMQQQTDAEKAASILVNNHLELVCSAAERAAKQYESYPPFALANGMDEDVALYFIRIECADDPCIRELPFAWETLCALEGKESADRATWSRLSNVMEEFSHRTILPDGLQAVCARLMEMSKKRERIIQCGDQLCRWMKDTFTDEWLTAFAPQPGESSAACARRCCDLLMQALSCAQQILSAISS